MKYWYLVLMSLTNVQQWNVFKTLFIWNRRSWPSPMLTWHDDSLNCREKAKSTIKKPISKKIGVGLYSMDSQRWHTKSPPAMSIVRCRLGINSSDTTNETSRRRLCLSLLTVQTVEYAALDGDSNQKRKCNYIPRKRQCPYPWFFGRHWDKFVLNLLWKVL